MSEREINKRLQKSIAVIVCCGILLLAGGGIFVYFLSNTLQEAIGVNMREETDEYKKRIHKQFASDVQLLESLAELIGSAGLTEREEFPELLEQVNWKNDFLTMSYVGADGMGIVVMSADGVQEDVPLETMQEETRAVAEKAFKGEIGVSRLFLSDFSSERVLAYGVPVYQEQRIIGVLMASSHVGIFSDILSGNRVMGGTGRIHMVSSSGQFLIFTRTVVADPPESLFGEPYLEGEELSRIQELLKQDQQAAFSFQHEGTRYRALLEPVGINGWYLLCVNSIEESSHFVLMVVEGAAVLLLAVMLLFSFLLIYGYRLTRNGNRALFRLAFYDPLTGALNFAGFRREAKEALEADPEASMVSLNIHQFKFINEILGKERSDQLLKQVKEQADKELTDGELFCRTSADHFYLLLKDTDRTRIWERMTRIMDGIQPAAAGEHDDYRVLFYCGVVVSSRKETLYSMDQMQTHVMFALAKARERHQNTIWFFDTKLHEKEVMDNYVEGHMNQALEAREFRLYLQPKISLGSGQIGGAEALVRWIRQDGKTIFPDQFIPLFEENGFCARLDLYMLEQACRRLREWTDAGLEPVPISVNQSKLTFFMPDYVNRIMAIVDRYQVPPRLLTLEILEGTALENVEVMNKRLESLHKKGFRISMDDFGSGYSSLNILGKLKIDELKLDRGFLMEAAAGENPNAGLIMEQVVQLSKKLAISTVVEGVETEANEQLIKGLGCDYGQGYLYSRPIPEEEFTERWVSRAKETPAP